MKNTASPFLHGIPGGPIRRFLGLLACLTALTAAAASRPNVVFIMPDDLSFDDYSLYNPDGPRTPHVDALSRESMRLTDFHVSPTCSPSRAAFMTGRANNATGVWHTVLGRYFLWPNEVTMADVFKANGYSTALFSKWHLGDSFPFRAKDRGFEYTVMIHGGGIDQQPDHWGNRDDTPGTLYVNDRPVRVDETNGSLPGEKGAFSTNYFTSEAIDYMKKKKADGKPFFAYLPYNVAHLPFDLPPDARPGVDARTATIENMDKNIGRILQFLDQSGLADNTLLVLVLGDNGLANARYRGDKATAYEAGHRVPCFVRWPAGGYGGSPEKSGEVAQLVGNIDLLPTLMDVLGLHDVAHRAKQVPIHGKSIKALMNKSDRKGSAPFGNRIMIVDNQREDELIKYKEACIMQNEFNSAGAVVHQWRLMLPSKDKAPKPAELYDVLSDPLEKTNLIGKSEHAKRVAALKDAYEVWWRTASVHAEDFSRPILGTKEEPETCLYAHDWHTGGSIPPWNQGMIASALKNNGFNSVTFGQAGDYIFDLRRWPRELAGETTVTSTLSTPIKLGSAGADGVAKLTKGIALPVRSARLRIWYDAKTYADEKQMVDPASDGAVFTVRSLPAGPAMVQTWFYDANGEELAGAYYNYVRGTEGGR